MTIFDEMVAELGPQTSMDKTNAQHEVMQQIALSGLQRGGFFEHAAFYGGTCLRIFHGLRRFSEDMDFTLTDGKELEGINRAGHRPTAGFRNRTEAAP